MPPKKGKKNAVTFYVESVIVPEKQQQGYQFRNGIAALIPEASQRFRVSILLSPPITAYQYLTAVIHCSSSSFQVHKLTSLRV